MHTARCLTGLALVCGVLGSPLGAQHLAHPADRAHGLLPGEKIRVWSTAPAFFYRPLLSFGMRPPRLVGTVLPPPAPDSLALRQTALIVGPWTSRNRTVYWGDVRRVDVADGRLGAVGVAGGALGGLIGAVMVSWMYSLVICMDQREGCSRWIFQQAARMAIVTVPVGAIWGGRSTRWRQAY